jgi:hypothetical protein
MMKQLLISFGGGLLLLCVWGAIVVATSQDFAHEGPNSVWFSPVEAWSRFLIDIGWARWISLLNPIPRYILGFTMLLGPFLLALSVVAHMVACLLRRMVATRKFR